MEFLFRIFAALLRQDEEGVADDAPADGLGAGGKIHGDSQRIIGGQVVGFALDVLQREGGTGVRPVRVPVDDIAGGDIRVGRIGALQRLIADCDGAILQAIALGDHCVPIQIDAHLRLGILIRSDGVGDACDRKRNIHLELACALRVLRTTARRHVRVRISRPAVIALFARILNAVPAGRGGGITGRRGG